MNLAGGGFLGKLARKGLVYRSYNSHDPRHLDGFMLTRKGLNSLQVEE
jgi:hypothetical protein